MEFEIVCRCIATRLGIDVADITPETSYAQDLGMDSVDLLGLIADIEKEFEIVLETESVREITTVSQTIDYIRQRIDRRGLKS